MLPIRLTNFNSIIKKRKNKFFEIRKFEIKQKRIGAIKNGFLPAITQENEENKNFPVKIDRVEAEI